jgi:hypothetical protein
MGEPMASEYVTIQASLDRNCFFACWNEDECDVYYASGPFGICRLAISNLGNLQPGGEIICATKRRTFVFKDRGE